MHRGQLLAALILTLAGIGAAAAASPAIARYRSEAVRTVNDIKALKSGAAKVERIQKMLAELKRVKQTGDEDDKISMNLFLTSFNGMPEAKAFDVNKCPAYVHDFVIKMKGPSGESPDSFVELAERIWFELCPAAR